MTQKHSFPFLLTILFLFTFYKETRAQTPVLTLTIHAIQPACGASSGEISFSASGGTPPYTYTFRGINTGGLTDISGLGPGVIPITVTDATGATASQTVTLTQTINPPTLTVSSYTNPTGCNTMDGTITVTPSGGKPPYLYTIDNINWQTSNVFTNLPTSASPDYITVKDANGCVGYAYNAPALVGPCSMRIGSYAYNSLIYSCGGKTSYIHIQGIVGGSQPYTYSLDGVNYSANSNFDNLGAGWYTVYVKDATGAILTETFLINDECAVKATYVATIADCGVNDGTITVTATGGATPYSYSLDGVNYQMNNNVLSSLASGSYVLRVRDLYGVTFTTIATVFDNCPMVTATATNSTCSNNNGSITAQGSNGTAPYKYSLDGITYQTSPLFSNRASGPYTVYIRDANNYIKTTSVTVGYICLQVTATPGPTTCGRSNGTITVTATNGTPPYSYSLDGINFQASNLFAGLPAGNYPNITAKDASGTATTAATITDIAGPQPSITITPSSCDAPDGSVLIDAIGGTGPFMYSIDGINFGNNDLFSRIGAGTVLIAAIKDGNGCTVSQPWTMTSKPPPQLAATATPATCLNNDGGILASNIGGSGPFQYSLDGNHYQSTGLFPSLPTGAQTIYIKDASGCIASQPVTVPLNNNLSVDPGSDLTICEGQTLAFTARSNGLSFSWSPATGLSNPSILDPVASPRSTTPYTLTASTAVCSNSATVTVTVNPAPTADAGAAQTICYGASAQLQGSGGQCSWSPSTWLDDPTSATPKVISPAQTITYQLMVTDANGCSSLQPATVTLTVTPQPLSAGDDTTVLKGQPVPLDAIDLNHTGFTNYTWSPSTWLSDPTSQAPIATPQETTTYTVEASSPAGCRSVSSMTIKVYTAVDIFVPSGFTPNGDGHNDYLKAIPMGIREFKYFAVYSRWGAQVFQTADPSKGWDGTINGQLQPAGPFVWMAAGVDYQGNLIQRKGTTILIR